MSEVIFNWHETLSEQHGADVLELYDDVSKQESFIGYTEPLNQAQQKDVLKNLAEDLLEKQKELMLIHYKSRTVGMVLLCKSSMPNCKHRVELSKGIIHSDYRHIGILPKALLEIGKHAQASGYKQLELDVRANSRSEKIWQQAGFIEYGRLKNYAFVNGEYEDGVYMYQSTESLINIFSQQV